VDLQRNKTSLHIVTSVGYSIEYYDARNNKYQVLILLRKERLNLYLIYTNLPRGLSLYRGEDVCAFIMTRRATLVANLAPDKATQAKQVKGHVQTK